MNTIELMTIFAGRQDTIQDMQKACKKYIKKLATGDITNDFQESPLYFRMEHSNVSLQIKEGDHKGLYNIVRVGLGKSGTAYLCVCSGSGLNCLNYLNDITR